MTEQGRPTARIQRADLSPALPRASGVPASSRETVLFNGYRGLTSDARIGPKRRTEACACGEDITAEVGWEAAAVDEHNLRPKHVAWRAWRES